MNRCHVVNRNAHGAGRADSPILRRRRSHADGLCGSFQRPTHRQWRYVYQRAGPARTFLMWELPRRRRAAVPAWQASVHCSAGTSGKSWSFRVVAFPGHPEPRATGHRAVSCDQTPARWILRRASICERTARRLPPAAAASVREARPVLAVRVPCERMSSSLAQFIFYYIGEGILHYHPNLFLKHRGMEKQFEGGDIYRGGLDRRTHFGRGHRCARARVMRQAVEDALGVRTCRRARSGFVSSQPSSSGSTTILHYLGHLVPHDHAEGW